MNASTFAARVIVSTRSDFVSAIAGAIGALKGPLHGGAPGPALDMVFEIGAAERAEAVLREKLSAASGSWASATASTGCAIRGPTCSPRRPSGCTRADGDRGSTISRATWRRRRCACSRSTSRAGELKTNVEFYTALLLHGLGLPTELFTPTFAVGRVAGWTAHCLEQSALGRLIRPQSEYVGSKNGTGNHSKGFEFRWHEILAHARRDAKRCWGSRTSPDGWGPDSCEAWEETKRRDHTRRNLAVYSPLGAHRLGGRLTRTRVE